jgi:hypothetical protein
MIEGCWLDSAGPVHKGEGQGRQFGYLERNAEGVRREHRREE